MRHCIILLPLAALAACANPASQGVEVRLVPTPVPVPCVPASEIPAEPAGVHSVLTGDAEADLLIVAASAKDLRVWGREMHVALTLCAE